MTHDVAAQKVQLSTLHLSDVPFLTSRQDIQP